MASKKPAPQPAPKFAKGDVTSLEARLAKLGLRRDFDLILHLPLRYEDETRLTPIGSAVSTAEVSVQVEGRVLDTEIVYRPRRQLIARLWRGAQRLLRRRDDSSAFSRAAPARAAA